MNNFRTQTVYAFALAALVAGLYAAPASAGGGRSGALAASSDSQTKASESLGHAQRETQSQIDELRKELTELKAQIGNQNTAQSK